MQKIERGWTDSRGERRRAWQQERLKAREVSRPAGLVPLSLSCFQPRELSSQSFRLPGQVGTDGKVCRTEGREEEKPKCDAPWYESRQSRGAVAVSDGSGEGNEVLVRTGKVVTAWSHTTTPEHTFLHSDHCTPNDEHIHYFGYFRIS